MPTIRDLSALFQSISLGDLGRAIEIARQIAAGEEKLGHHIAAQRLKGALQSNGMRGHTSPPFQAGSSAITAALSRRNEPTRLTDVMLRPEASKVLRELISEHEKSAHLKRHGIRPRAKLIFVGPPGCGKTFTSQALANEMGLPHYVVRFDAIIGAYLGQTAIHLHELFRFSRTTPCVLSFDEIDALGKQRGNPLDVGELDRIVIALMQELEFLETEGIVIATSNLPENLDRALWRRFDLALKFPKPTKQELAIYAKTVSEQFGVTWNDKLKTTVSRLTDYAEAKKAIEGEARRKVLQEL
jgi:SpoVK/Ycf46/Vps4 family AAA+-type ATPase